MPNSRNVGEKPSTNRDPWQTNQVLKDSLTIMRGGALLRQVDY